MSGIEFLYEVGGRIRSQHTTVPSSGFHLVQNTNILMCSERDEQKKFERKRDDQKSYTCLVFVVLILVFVG